MARRISLGLAVGLAALAALPAAQPARSQEALEVCSQLTPAEAGSLIGDAVVTPRPASTAELADLAGTIAATAAASPTAGTPPLRPVGGGACSYLATVAGTNGLPPSQVQLVVNRFADAAAAAQAFEAARKALRLMRPGNAAVDAPVEQDAGGRSYSTETTALAVRGDTVVLLSVIDFAVLIRGKPAPTVMEQARLLARRVAGM